MAQDLRDLRLPERSSTTVVVESEIAITLTLCALVGNTLAILAFYKNRTIQSASNLLVVNLSFTGIFAALTTHLLVIPVLVSGVWTMGTHACVYQALQNSFLFTTMHLSTTLISLNRYLVIVRFKKYSNISKRSFMRKLQALIFIFSAVLAFSNLISKEKITFRPKEAICTLPRKKAAIPMITVLIQDMAFAATLFLNLATFKFVRAHHRKVTSLFQSSNISTAHNRHALNSTNINRTINRRQNPKTNEELYLAKKALIVTVVYCCCWVPQGAVNTVSLFNKDFPREFCMASTFSMQLTSVLNPVLYAMLNRKFRRAILALLAKEDDRLTYRRDANTAVRLNSTSTFTRFDSTRILTVTQTVQQIQQASSVLHNPVFFSNGLPNALRHSTSM